MVRRAGLRLRKHALKVDKWAILRRYKFAKIRMVRHYDPSAKLEFLMDDFATRKAEEWGLTAYQGRLYLNWLRAIWSLTLVRKGLSLERGFNMARHYFVRAIAYNLWLDRAPVLKELTPAEIIAKTLSELYALVDESRMFLKPLEGLVSTSEDFIRFLSVHYAFNIPSPSWRLEIEKIERVEPERLRVVIEVTEVE